LRPAKIPQKFSRKKNQNQNNSPKNIFSEKSLKTAFLTPNSAKNALDELITTVWPFHILLKSHKIDKQFLTNNANFDENN